MATITQLHQLRRGQNGNNISNVTKILPLVQTFNNNKTTSLLKRTVPFHLVRRLHYWHALAEICGLAGKTSTRFFADDFTLPNPNRYRAVGRGQMARGKTGLISVVRKCRSVIFPPCFFPLSIRFMNLNCRSIAPLPTRGVAFLTRVSNLQVAFIWGASY